METSQAAYNPMRLKRRRVAEKENIPCMSPQRTTFRRINFALESLDSPLVKQVDSVSFQLIDDQSSDSGFADTSLRCCFEDNTANMSLDSPMLFADSTNFASPQNKTNERPATLKAKSKSFGYTSSNLCQRFNEDEIIKALENVPEIATAASSERFIGDMSRKHTLPILTQSKHNDLASITPQTVTLK